MTRAAAIFLTLWISLLIATSIDGQTASSAPVSFSVVDFEEQALTQEITSPGEGDTVTAPVAVTGTESERHAFSRRQAPPDLLSSFPSPPLLR